MAITILRPNSDLVAQAWLRTIDEVVNVGMTVPDQESSWAADGFVQEMVTGGDPHPDFALRRPIVTCWCWAVKVGSRKPPWELAAGLAEAICQAAYDEAHVRVPLTITAGSKTYRSAIIKEVLVRTEPRPMPGDPGGRARYMIDLEFDWVAP